MPNKIFGIDQTGAANGSSRAKPLKACEIILDSNEEILNVTFFKISEFGIWIKKLDPNFTNHIFIDCVLGLPIELYNIDSTRTLRDWILETKDFQFEMHKYGRKASEAFFTEVLRFYNLSSLYPPKRAVEVSLKSNSVFTTMPYQKNIQTGTYRIWKELGAALQDVVLWPSDFYLRDEASTIMYEVYPSFFYKTLLNTKIRKPEPVIKYLRSKNLSVSDTLSEAILDPDNCDALVAALGGLNSLRKEDVWSFNDDNIFFEGGILGST